MDISNISSIVSAFFSYCFHWLLVLLVSAVQLITYPVNVLMTNAFPTISDQITNVVVYLNQQLTFLPYALTFLPYGVSALLVFILGVEITFLYIFRSSFFVTKLWTIVRNIKFW